MSDQQPVDEHPLISGIEFTAPTADELSKLVVDSWVESFRKSPWAGCVRNDMYQTTQRATIMGILGRGAVVTVALAPRVEGVMGYAVTEPKLECLHWIYVKQDYRGNGVGRKLLQQTCQFWTHPRYSHRTRASSFLPRVFRWDPIPARVLAERAP
jgi:GNAT superfamily N-acetyltransferase